MHHALVQCDLSESYGCSIELRASRKRSLGGALGSEHIQQTQSSASAAYSSHAAVVRIGPELILVALTPGSPRSFPWLSAPTLTS